MSAPAVLTPVSPVRVVTLPSGRQVRLSTYVRAWRTLLSTGASVSVKDFDWFPRPAGEVLREIRRGLHERINRHVPWYGKGRKWDSDFQCALARDARRLNAPRRAIRRLETAEARSRFPRRQEVA